MEHYRLGWLTDEESAVLLELYENSTWQDFDIAVIRAHEMISTKSEAIPLIIKVQEKLPDGNPIMHFSRAARNQPENMGKIIIIVPSMVSFEMRLMSRILTVMKKIFPGKRFVTFVATYDEAVALATQSNVAQMGA
ncbi:MAG: hypothetical protein RLP44_26220 [Aggregatilineales bacterium]